MAAASGARRDEAAGEAAGRGVGVRESGWTVSGARCCAAGAVGSGVGSAAASAIFRPRPRSRAARLARRARPASGGA